VIGVGDAVARARREWTAVATAWIGGLAALVVWLTTTPAGTLRQQLEGLQFWWLEACVLSAAVTIVLASTRIDWANVREKVAPAAALIALALCLTVFVAPRTHRIFYDEQIYQSVGQNLSDLRRAQVCNDGAVESGRLVCAAGEYNKQPYAYPHLLSIGYRIAGVHDWVGFAVNAIAMAFSVGCAYLLTLALFADRTAAFFAALIFALIPQQIVWSATAAVEPTASLAVVAAVLVSAWYVRRGGALALAALAIASAYGIQFRPESILMLPVAVYVAWPRLRVDMHRPRVWWAAVLFLALAAAHAAHLFAIRHINWGTEGPRFSLGFVLSNLKANGGFYVGDERFPIVYTALAVVGLIGSTLRRPRLAMGSYFLLFFGVDLLFYAGSYDYGADVRYSLMTYPPLAVLGGVGAARLSQAVARRAQRVPATALLTVVLLFQFLWYAPAVRTVDDGAWAARADVRFAKRFAAQLPKDAYVLTQNPGMFQVWGVSAGQMSRVVANPAYAAWLVRQHAGGVYVHWNFWCNVQEPTQPDLCRKAMALGRTSLAAEEYERDQRFAFYRLDLPAVAFNNAVLFHLMSKGFDDDK
jgi:hypothetical protein